MELDVAALEQFLSHCSRSTVPKKHLIVREGEPADTLYFLIEGSATVMMEDKDAAANLRALRVGERDLVAVPEADIPRAMAPEKLLAAIAEVCPRATARRFGGLGPALRWLGEAKPRGTICVTGSFYHLAPARTALRRLGRG